MILETIFSKFFHFKLAKQIPKESELQYFYRYFTPQDIQKIR